MQAQGQAGARFETRQATRGSVLDHNGCKVWPFGTFQFVGIGAAEADVVCDSEHGRLDNLDGEPLRSKVNL
jgi:hypothetical protein